MSKSLRSTWKQLHGAPLPTTVAPLADAAASVLSTYRADDFTAAANVFEAAVERSANGHGLLLWEGFGSVLPVHTLGNGDILFVSVPRGGAPATLVWNHERDDFVAASDEDLAEVEGGDELPRGDAAQVLRFTARSRYLVDLLVHGRFDLARYTSFPHVPLATDGTALFDNVRTWPPTGMYAMWHLLFLGDEAGLARVLAAAAESTSRWVRDSAAVIEQLRDGRDDLGALRGFAATRTQVARIISDPKTTEQIAVAERRADIEARILQPQSPIRLVRDDADSSMAEPVTSATFGDLALAIEEQKYGQLRLVLREHGRIRSVLDVANTPDAVQPHEPGFVVVQDAPPIVALWRCADPQAAMFPHNGSLWLVGVNGRHLVTAASFEFDVDHLETSPASGRRSREQVVARTADGAGYRVDVVAGAPLPAPSGEPLPGSPAEPPPQSPALEISGDRLELADRVLRLWRGKKLLFEEPVGEAYAMTAIPGRRMVAIYGVGMDLRPIVDVYYVRELTRKVKPGQGTCSWVSFPVDGLPVELRSTEDRLYVYDGESWIEIDDEPLTEVPSWIRSRGWVK